MKSVPIATCDTKIKLPLQIFFSSSLQRLHISFFFRPTNLNLWPLFPHSSFTLSLVLLAFPSNLPTLSNHSAAVLTCQLVQVVLFFFSPLSSLTLHEVASIWFWVAFYPNILILFLPFTKFLFLWWGHFAVIQSKSLCVFCACVHHTAPLGQGVYRRKSTVNRPHHGALPKPKNGHMSAIITK